YVYILDLDSFLHDALPIYCIVGEGSTVRQSVVSDSKIGNQVDVGPFANIRPETDIGNDVKVGNFVKLKKTSLGNDTKVSHLTYLDRKSTRLNSSHVSISYA